MHSYPLSPRPPPIPAAGSRPPPGPLDEPLVVPLEQLSNDKLFNLHALAPSSELREPQPRLAISRRSTGGLASRAFGEDERVGERRCERASQVVVPAALAVACALDEDHLRLARVQLVADYELMAVAGQGGAGFGNEKRVVGFELWCWCVLMGVGLP